VRRRYADYSKLNWHAVINDAVAFGDAKRWCKEIGNIPYRTYKRRRKEYMSLPLEQRPSYKYRKMKNRRSRTLTDSADKLSAVRIEQLHRSGSSTPRRRSLSAVLAHAATERLEFHHTENDLLNGTVSPPVVPESPDKYGRGVVDRFIAVADLELVDTV